MASDTVCKPAPADRLSSRVGPKAGSVWLPDLESLRTSRDFRRVLKDGKRRRKGGVVVVRSTGRPDSYRLGLIVSKGTGNAVTRNRIKRRLRHAVGELSLKPGMDYVIIASGQVAEAGFAQIKGWISRAVEDLDR
jgi:ribonuclease P protein component